MIIKVMSVSAKKIVATRPCPISGSKNSVLISSKDRNGKPLRNLMSVESGLIYVDPVPFENTEEFYKSDYRKSYKGVHCPKPKHVYRAAVIAQQRLSRLINLIPSSSRCLDAGSSSGEFVYLLNSKGFLAEGVEANMPYAEYSVAELKIPVTISPFSQFQSEQKFDLITMFHVLEHLENPVLDLAHLGQFLKPGGHFIIEVPNILYADMAFSHKWHPGHLFSYSSTTLSMLMEKAGFETVTCVPIGDAANLWGVFKTSGQKKVLSTKLSKSASVELSFEELKKGKILYHLRFWNYFKFVSKIFSNSKEKFKTIAKNGREILDAIF
jgi:2-polyprenyl-3-methyl-5-hydroxy-6-metoxy-1,4-benzoquinol methylase